MTAAAEERDRDRHLRAVKGGAESPSVDAQEPVVDEFFNDEDPDYEPLLKDGLYEVSFRSEEKVYLHKRHLWVSHMQVIGGCKANEGLGEILNLWIPIPRMIVVKGIEKLPRPRPSWVMAQVYGVATSRRPPSNLAGRKPSNYLAGCSFLAVVGASKKDSKGNVRPTTARYSKILALTKLLTGTPPCMRTKQ